MRPLADGDVAVVIDSGPPGAAEALLAALDAHGIARIDLWIHTHFDADHLGGILRAVDGIDGIAGTEDSARVHLNNTNCPGGQSRGGARAP